MDNKNNYFIMGAVVFVAVLAAGLLLGTLSPQGQNALLAQDSAKSNMYAASVPQGGAIKSASGAEFASTSYGSVIDRKLITVSGSVVKTAAPEEALIEFSVETLDKSASESQKKNADLSAKVRDALKAIGVEEANIKTTSYTLYEEFQWDEFSRKSISSGYRTSNTIEVKILDLSNTGKVIDAAVKAGVNRVSGVTFTLSKESEAQLRTQALKDAAQSAKEKAQSIAAGFGVGVGGLYSASEGYSYVPVYRNLNYAKDAAAEAGGFDTPITPGDVKLTVNVDAQFEIV
ncbi:MAG TPA: SIMPL domain-containing protein [archaeon]|nr:SIMPL domain-containing protein [archaeon]